MEPAELQVCAPPSILTQILIDAVDNELLVTCIDTGPGPSLTNEKVLEVASGSLCASSIMSLKVMLAVGAL